VVCHDAGASNLIFAWLRHWCEAGLLDQHVFNLMLQGPAEKAWLNLPIPLPQVQIFKSLEFALEGSQTVLTGTGWSSSLEHQARQLAIQMSFPSIAVLDHWVNYAQRFERDNVLVMPDQIWVSDHVAESIAKDLFANTPVLTLPNLYLQNLVKRIPAVPMDCRNLLYVLEPVRNDWGRGVPGEFQALDYFIQHLTMLFGNDKVNITLRPHPSDPPNKYKSWVEANPLLDIRIDSQSDLSEAITQAKWVVGVESFALVVANAAGRETFSSLPPWAHKLQLPDPGIKQISKILADK